MFDAVRTFGWMLAALTACSASAQTVPSEGGTTPPTRPGIETVPNTPPTPGAQPPREATPAAVPKLLVGEAAPALSVQKWVRGPEVQRFEPGRVYVVEFWATWCSPCRKSMSNLTELQQRHGQAVTVIGLASQEPGGLADVEKLVKLQGERIGYAIAWDDAGKSNQAWMEAAGQEFIPTAFVVEKTGRIAWIGHPLDGLDQVVAAIIGGTFDLAKETAAAKHRAEIMSRAVPLKEQLEEHLAAGQTAEAVAKLDQIIALDPALMGDYAYAKFITLAVNARDPSAAYKFASEAVDGVLKDNPQVLSALAWTIAENPAIERRDFNVALKAAERANAITQGKSPPILAGLARVAAELGQIDRAIDLQQQAVNLETDKSMKDEMSARLEGYRKRPQLKR